MEFYHTKHLLVYITGQFYSVWQLNEKCKICICYYCVFICYCKPKQSKRLNREFTILISNYTFLDRKYCSMNSTQRTWKINSGNSVMHFLIPLCCFPSVLTFWNKLTAHTLSVAQTFEIIAQVCNDILRKA